MDMNENSKEPGKTIFDCLSPNCGTILSSVIADIIAEGLDPIQIVVVASFITSVTSNMFYIASQMDLNNQIASRQKVKASVAPGVAPPAP